jgi:hypothetical protein
MAFLLLLTFSDTGLDVRGQQPLIQSTPTLPQSGYERVADHPLSKTRSMSVIGIFHQPSWPERYERGVYTVLSPAVFSSHFRRSTPLMSSQTVNSNAPGTMNAGSQLAL